MTINSLNFEPILRWKPGPGTPPGTAYQVKYSCHGKRLLLKPSFLNSSITMLNLTGTFKNPKEPYAVHVRALNFGMTSPWSSQLFCPYSNTVLGPPRVSVTGHEDRLLLNITLPRGKANETIEEIYHKVSFSIFWKKAGEIQEYKDTTTQNKHFINNLNQGVEYCVRVQPEIIENPNLLSSDWTCHFTSPLPYNTVPTTLACVSVILILGGAALLGLVYTGFLCNLNTRPPNALQMTRVQSFILTMGVIVPDEASVISGTGGATEGGAQDDDDDDEDEEHGGDAGYENRGAGFSEATSSSSSGVVVSRTTDTSVSEGSANSRTSGAVGVECGGPSTVGVLCQDERASTGPSLSEQIDEGEEEDGMGVDGCCADINLLSVALGAQDMEDEESGEEEGWAAKLQATDSAGELLHLVSVDTGEGSRLMELGSLQTDSTALPSSPCSSNRSECGKSRSRYLRLHSEESIQADSHSALGEEEEAEEEEEDNGEYSGYMRR